MPDLSQLYQSKHEQVFVTVQDLHVNYMSLKTNEFFDEINDKLIMQNGKQERLRIISEKTVLSYVKQTRTSNS